MKISFTFLLLLISTFSFAQIYEVDHLKPAKRDKEDRNFGRVAVFEAILPFEFNSHHGEYFADGSEDKAWILPTGLGAKVGYGYQFAQSLALTLNTGIEWNAREHLYLSPLFLNFNFSPFVSEQGKIFLQAGFGRTFAIGKGNLQGFFQRYSVGLESEDGIAVFIDVNLHGIRNDSGYSVGSVSLGVSKRIF